MKKIFLSVIACAGLLTACDMNTTQYGVIDDTAELSFDYITQNRNYSVYSALRGCTFGSWVYDTELQLDQFIALSTNGGRGMNIADGSINPSNGSATGTFEGMYSRIAQVNFMIEKAQNALDQGNPTTDEAAELSRYVAEGKFARAYFYFYLFDHFCQTYDSAKGDTEGLGLQLVTVYNPDGDTSKYPGRSSMNATLELINGDLLDAFNGLQAYEKAGNTSYTVAGSNYLSSYAAAALQARVALVTGKYADAIAKANYVIGGKYSLATGDDYVDMWYDENVDELIFTPFVNKDEISSPTSFSIAQGWNYWWPGKTDQCDYIPTQESVLSLAEFEDAEGYINDVRFESFVANIPIAVEGGTTKGYAFVKYPGNPSLNSSNTNYYMNTPKPFRLSEQYLIKAEAAALNDDPATANSAISDESDAIHWRL